MTFDIRFWGVRGSIACPSTEHIKYGGNTSCIEVSVGDRIFVLDAGTGIRGLGQEFLKRDVREAHLLLTHTHWDHVGAMHEWDAIGVHPNGKAQLANDYSAGCKDFVENWKGKPFPEGFDPGSLTIPPGNFGWEVKEGDVIDLGGRTLRVWDTPGHSPCSISLYDDKEGVLVTGDLVRSGEVLFRLMLTN